MRPSRRDILRAGISVGLGAALDGLSPLPGLGLAFAEGNAAGPLLVVLHLRGGADGLHLLSPADDPDFVAARQSELRVATTGADAGHRIDHSPDERIDFRLHPQANALFDLYREGHLALIPAAGLAAAIRSHFVAIDMIEHGVADAAALARSDSGWLARYLRGQTKATSALTVAAAGAPSGEYLGWGKALSVPDLGGGFGVPGVPPMAQLLGKVYADAQGAVGAAGRDALAAIKLVDEHLPRDDQGKPIAYQPAQKGAYDLAGDFARPLKVVAQLAKLDVGLSVATVDFGGWDTHENQPGRFRVLVERLSVGLSAFWNDLAPRHDRLTIVVQTEFGRRFRSNRSAGTDHGRGSLMMVLGGKVQGGVCYGSWPGLKAKDLDEGVDLAVATDYRQVVSEVLAAHRGGPVAKDVFPGYAGQARLGLFRDDRLSHG
ncbi:MAG TPA: DUF1501 domain-containing protein [Stellaceae bacterium]|nr:DUF1501 domain-containing protein [Stellaceae bacterium]